MNISELMIVLSVVSVGFFGFFIFIRHQFQSRPTENTQATQLLQEKKELEGKFSEVMRQNDKLSSELNSKDRLLDGTNKRVYSLENQLKEKQKEVSDQISLLSQSKQKFQEEQERVEKEEKEKRIEAEKDRDRIWSQHEERSLIFMKEVCEKKDIALPCYSNTDTPPDFPATLKPDFMIKLLDQYVIFDAKLSKSSNINKYIKDQVKKSSSKYKQNNELIFPSVFFVIPSMSIGEIKETYFYHENFHFYVIPVEAFEPILRSLKKLEDYSFAESLDPENREKIVQAIAHLFRHIKEQNAVNLLGTDRGLEALKKLKELPADLFKEVHYSEENMRFDTFSLKGMKDIKSPEEQKEKLLDFIEPQKAKIQIKDIAQTGENLKFDQPG